MKRVLKMLLLVFFLIIIYVYTLLIESIPNELVIFEGENISMKTLLGITIKDKNNQTIEVSSNNGNSLSNETGKKSLEVSLFNNILLKNVDVSVLPKATVIPVGKIAGLKLHTNGVLVVGMSEIEGQDKKRHKPYENTGIEEGDTIIKINETEIESTNQLIETVNLSKGNSIQVKFIHEEETKECSITPVQTSSNEYKLGLWVRDSAAGVGTVTFYEPSTKTFGALGHGIKIGRAHV